MNKTLSTIRRKGLFETCLYGLKLLYFKVFSLINIFLLRLRGYNIDYSVLLKGNNFFFQSTKNAISIKSNSTIGQHTRISGGGNGTVTIGKGVLIDDFTFVMAHEKITIGKNTKIAAFCFITDFNHKYQNMNLPLVSQGYETRPVTIGENVWIGTHCVVLPGITIGNRAVIGAGSVVTRDIPPLTVAVGNPAKVIKKIKG